MSRSFIRGGGDLLDFGCGKGDVVQTALSRGWRARGVEYFGPGSGTNIQEELQRRGLLGAHVLAYDGRTLPFDKETFDVVVSNQVFEHVPDLPTALREICRVLRQGGTLVCSFPYADAVREGHCNVPFAHWFPRSKARVLWLFLFRSLGFGRLKRKGTKWQWAHFFNDWLEENTFYLPGAKIEELFSDLFECHGHAEDLYLSYRLADRGWGRLASLPTRPSSRGLTRWFGRAFGSLVIVARKGSATELEDVSSPERPSGMPFRLVDKSTLHTRSICIRDSFHAQKNP